MNKSSIFISFPYKEPPIKLHTIKMYNNYEYLMTLLLITIVPVSFASEKISTFLESKFDLDTDTFWRLPAYGWPVRSKDEIICRPVSIYWQLAKTNIASKKSVPAFSKCQRFSLFTPTGSAEMVTIGKHCKLEKFNDSSRKCIRLLRIAVTYAII